MKIGVGIELLGIQRKCTLHIASDQLRAGVFVFTTNEHEALCVIFEATLV